MTCPVCNAQNPAMSARCLECGTLLIREAVARSADVQRTINDLDKRMYMGYGGLAGFVLGMGSWFLFSRNEDAVQGWLVVCVVAGTVLGRVFARRKRNTL